MHSIIGKAGALLRYQEPRAYFGRLRAAVARRLHQRLWDRRFAKFESYGTASSIAADRLAGVESPNIGHSREYYASPRLIVQMLIDGLDIDPGQYEFIDFGSGRGRVLMAASERGFRRVRGIEFSRELHDEAQINIRHYPQNRMQCRDTSSLWCDAVQFEQFGTRPVLYFFNPFNGIVLQKVLDNVRRKAGHGIEDLFVIFLNPKQTNPLAEATWLADVTCSLRRRWLIDLMSPYEFRVYRLNLSPDDRGS